MASCPVAPDGADVRTTLSLVRETRKHLACFDPSIRAAGYAVCRSTRSRECHGLVADLLSPDQIAEVYPAHAIIRNFFGSIMRKLSVTSSHQVRQFPGTSSRRNLSIAVLKSLKVA